MKKTNQLIWLDAVTHANLTQLYVKSGAYQNWALNEFIARILSVVLSDENLMQTILKNLYSQNPELKQYSFFVEKVTIPSSEIRKVIVCPECLMEFTDLKKYREHMKEHFSKSE
jgi:hypothetical protein